MAEAIALAWRGLYTTHPNPRVGCVVVKDDNIVGRGWHQIAGEGHAEVNALAQAGAAAHGATVYVSLEPCSHHGKTPPCAEALVRAGVAKVIGAMEDPNPSVSGRGYQILQQAGIETQSGLLQEQAQQLNPGFVKRMQTGLPWVTVKSAMSVDGRTAMADGESKWITGPAARADVQRYRARVEAIITGVETVLADDPALTVRPDMWAQESLDPNDQTVWSWPKGFEPIQPIRVVLDSQLRTPLDAKILTQSGQTWIACCEKQEEKAKQLEGRGARVLVLPADKEGRVDLLALLKRLAEAEVNEVLVEAGAGVAGAFVEQKQVDQWVCYMAPKLMGSRAKPVLNLPSIQSMDQALDLHLSDVRKVGRDVRFTYLWEN